MEVLEKIQALWKRVTLVQRALLIAVVLTCIIAGFILTQWVSRPDMRVLYKDLEASEASKITEKISEQNIDYELRDGGTTILVDKQHVYQLRLDMAKEGLPIGGQQGYNIFDNEKVGVSPMVQNVNMLRALQEELAKSVQMIDGVARARIHIVSSKRSVFTSNKTETTASVMLQMRPGYRLSPSNVAAIRHLVAGGVEGLESGNVTITDSEGNLLARESDESTDNGASTVQDYRERVEKNLESKAEDMLTTFLGPGRASVKVSAVIDMESGSQLTTTYDPKMRVVKKEESTSKSDQEGTTLDEDGTPTVQGGSTSDEKTLTEWEVSKTVEEKMDLPGTVTSLSVAAVVDLSMPDANGVTVAGGPKIMEVEQVKTLIANALGLKLTTSDPAGSARDSISVVETVFYKAQESSFEDEKPGFDYVAIAGQASMGIMAICALVVLKIFGGSKKASPAQTGNAALTSASGEPAGLLGSGEEITEPQALRREISEIMKSNPDQVKQLFSSWVGQ